MNRLFWFVLCALAIVSTAGAQYSDSIFYGDSRALLRNPFGWGYIAGTNGYGDIGKYQRFDWYETPYIVAARLYFGAKQVVGTPDTLTIVVRDGTAEGPGALLASARLLTSAIDTTGKGNLVTFASPARFQGDVFLEDSLFIGVEWAEAIDDTFGLFTDSSGYGERKQRAWEQINYNNAWTMWPWINSPDANFEWNLDADIWIKAYLSTSPTSVPGVPETLPERSTLLQNYPNPFNPLTRIELRIRNSEFVVLKVYDLLGREVASLLNERRAPGRHTVEFDGSGLPSGAYICRLQSGTTVESRRMMLLR